MCRVLAYLGKPVVLDDLLYKPDSSLVQQTYNPRMLHALNLAGFGLLAWDASSYDPAAPFEYRTTAVPVFDANLKALSQKLNTHCLLAHVRGVAYSHEVAVSEQNLHPFRFAGFPLGMAHNGDLARFEEMKFDLLDHIKPEIARMVRGSTDSEWVYALLVSQLEHPDRINSLDTLVRAIEGTYRTLRKVRDRAGIKQTSSVNLYMSDGIKLLSTRFTFDFGCYGDTVDGDSLVYSTQWYTLGHEYGLVDGEWKMVGGARAADSVIVASEPLTQDVSTWMEVPEYSVLSVHGDGQARKVQTTFLDA